MLTVRCRLVMWMWWYPKYVFSVGSFWLPTAFHNFLWNAIFWSLKSHKIPFRVQKFCDTSRLRAWRLKQRHQWRLPELSEQQTSQGWPKDGEAHGDNAVPEPELPGGHVMVQQEKRKHGHCTLLTCERSNGTDGWDQIRDQGRSWQTGDEKLDEKVTRGNKVQYTTSTKCLIYCTSLTKHYCFSHAVKMRNTSWIHAPPPITVKYDEDVVSNCLACKTEQHGFLWDDTSAQSNTAHQHAAHLGLFLESVNNRCLTRKRIPSVTLSNGGLALFLKHKKENTTKTQKLPQMKQTSQRPFSQNKKFLSDSKTFSVWHSVWG